MSALGRTADAGRAVILGAAFLAVSSSGVVATPRAAAALAQVRIAEPAAVEASLQVDRTTVRSRYIAVTIDQLPGAGPFAPNQATAPNTSIALELFPDVSIVAIFDRFDPNPRGVTWVGHVSGVEGSTVTLIYGDGLLTGNVLTPAATYTIRPAPAALRGATRLAAGQLHVAAQIDLTALPIGAAPVEVVISDADRAAATARLQALAPADAADFIDVLVVYTPAAVAQSGGVQALLNLVDLNVSETNSSYAASGVAQRLRLAHTAEVSYAATCSRFVCETILDGVTDDLVNLMFGRAGLEVVLPLRDFYAADVVTLVDYTTTPFCGIASMMAPTADAGFAPFAMSVVHADCMATGHLFAHELGHNMGLRHDWFNDNSTIPYSYGHGHVSTAAGNRWHTLMAYSNLCNVLGISCQPLLRWSNPTQTLNGVPLGVPAGTSTACTLGSPTANTCDADEHMVLNDTAAVVANFRQAASAGQPGAFSRVAPGDGAFVGAAGSVTLTWQSSFGATAYEYCYDIAHNSTCEGTWTSTIATSVVIGGLSPSATYSWQVRALNVNGTRLASGASWGRFRTTLTADPLPFARFAGGYGPAAQDGTGDLAGFNAPTSVASASDGTLYVTDHNNHTIRRITPTGVVSTLAGSPGVEGSADGTGSTARFRSPIAVAVDSVGTIYVADKGNHTVRAISPAGVVTTLAGLAGVPGATDGTGSAARFRLPQGIAVDGTGTVYVADTENHTIRAIAPGGVVSTLAGLAGSPGSANGTGSAARFTFPGKMDFGGAGLIYVVDNQTIRTITPEGSVATLAGLAGVCGNIDGVGAAARFCFPSGVAVAGDGTVYVGDNSTIRTITPGGVVTTIAGLPGQFGTLGPVSGPADVARFGTPADFAFDNAGTLYIVDGQWNTILRRGLPVAGLNLIRNPHFSQGDPNAAGVPEWKLFALPDTGAMVWNQVSNVFRFYRYALPPGATGQAVIFQETGMPLDGGAPITARFDLGNSSLVRKRISVVIHDANFSDLSVCTFWLPQNTPLTTFTMRTRTTKAWAGATISFYAASVGSNGGHYVLDNVEMSTDPDDTTDRTECDDPFAPPPTPGSDGPNLLVNGSFDTGTLAPWGSFGTITHQIAAGVFEFIRPTSTPPAGVVLQATGQAMTPNQILTATFDLGNSSAVRKRVTVILHENDFSDLSACTFWLAPGQPLSPYTYRTFTTKAWTNATVSIYAATVGPDPWMRLDNVTLRRTPNVAITGTECVEPVGPAAGSTTFARPGFGPGWWTAIADTATSGRTTLAVDATGRRWRARGFVPADDSATEPGWVSTPDDAGTHTLDLVDWIDLTTATGARLHARSRLTTVDSRAFVQVSRDGFTWEFLHDVTASEDWLPIDIDLAAYLGQRVLIRFVFDASTTPPGLGPDVWHIDDVHVAIELSSMTRGFRR